jgi:anion-transporting  ArsA/GET3 family ATPase
MNDLNELLESRIIVCTGSGGVGKTTISASIGLEAATRGLKTIVVTIDPAKRLANSLGLAKLSNTPKRIHASKFKAAGMKSAPLEAMMLDTKTTFDELIYRNARDEQRAERIINNRFYQAISGALSGTHEYMAMEKLYELDSDGKYDLIVIDTPPARNALDFLEAPKRLTSFLEDRMLKWFLLPAISGGRGVFRVVNFAAVTFLKVVQRIVGAQLLKDTAEFLANFEGMYEGFKERAQSVFELLRQESTAFIVVTAPTSISVNEALFFASTLNDYGLPFKGLIVNRIHPWFETNGGDVGEPVVDLVRSLAAEFRQVSAREERSLERLRGKISENQWARIPYLNEEVVDLAALRKVASFIFI